ncbi:MAG: hypothetical protein HUJ65_06410 [Oscillospiraceae bacterium]|nr:hypothetical protein [Oscillospiraceae bacterium]
MKKRIISLVIAAALAFALCVSASATYETYDDLLVSSGPSVSGVQILIAVVIAAVIALIVCLIMKAKNKSAVAQHNANRYVVKNGVRITNRVDVFMNRTIERIPKNNQNRK